MIFKSNNRNFPSMDTFIRNNLVVLVFVSSAWISNCSGYFFNYPSKPLEPQYKTIGANPNNGGFLNRMGIAPAAETLWIGSHKINWSPLPLFLKFANPNLYQQQHQPEAQARKFQEPPAQFISNSPQSYDPFNSQPSPFGFAPMGNFFSPGPTSPSQFPPPSQSTFAEPRSSTVLPEFPYSTVSQVPSTTPSPPSSVSMPVTMQSFYTSAHTSSSPRNDIITALSTPGPNISPIIDQLRKMTEWSKHKFSKKEGKPEHPFKVKKIKKKYQDRSNIEAIILADDDTPLPKRVVKHKRKGKVVESTEIIEGKPAVLNPSPRPTNTVYLFDPLDVQQSALKKYQISRQDKKLGMFKTEDAIERPSPFSFKFGPQDAKVHPYKQ